MFPQDLELFSGNLVRKREFSKFIVPLFFTKLSLEMQNWLFVGDGYTCVKPLFLKKVKKKTFTICCIGMDKSTVFCIEFKKLAFKKNFNFWIVSVFFLFFKV